MRTTASRWPRAVLSRLRTAVRWVSFMGVEPSYPTHPGWGLAHVLGTVEVAAPVARRRPVDGDRPQVVEDDGEHPSLAPVEGGAEARECPADVVGRVERLGPSRRVERHRRRRPLEPPFGAPRAR